MIITNILNNNNSNYFYYVKYIINHTQQTCTMYVKKLNIISNIIIYETICYLFSDETAFPVCTVIGHCTPLTCISYHKHAWEMLLLFRIVITIRKTVLIWYLEDYHIYTHDKYNINIPIYNLNYKNVKTFFLIRKQLTTYLNYFYV